MSQQVLVSPSPRLRPDSYDVELLTSADLSQATPAWRDLFDDAIESNPFYGPDYLNPLVLGLTRGEGFRALAAWRSAPGGARRLEGFMPIRMAAAPFAPVRGFEHPYVVGCAPLIASHDPEAIADALLGALAARMLRPLLILEDLRLDFPAWRALEAACRSRGLPVAEGASAERGAIAVPGAPAATPKKLAANLRRCTAKLARLGAVSASVPREPDAARAALESMLEMEGAGWKGLAGTAFACRPETLAFARAGFEPTNTHPRVRFSVLSVDDAPVAVCVHLVGRGLAANFKCAYDETQAAASPGVLLDAAIVEEARGEGWTPLLDSVSLPGHPVERLWPDRVRVGWGAIGCTPGMAGVEFNARLALEHARRNTRAFVKSLYRAARGEKG